MKRLLFLSFLINISCFDILKSTEDEEEDEEDEEDDERREGTRQGDCTDGEDNDDDGDIDCDDSGCSDKPACEGDTDTSTEPDVDPESDTVDFYGEFTDAYQFDPSYEDLGYNDCTITLNISPAYDTITDAASCPYCTVLGYVLYERETNCD